ncbi:MAG: hypothetical protein ABI036_11280, partial [Fibrobacteria bacterium]
MPVISLLLTRCLSALLAAVLSVFLLGSCTSGTTSGTETGGKIDLQGRVVDKDNAPVSGLVARLSLTGLADTTDATGRFAILGEIQDPAKTGILDTLIILQDSQRVASVRITK